MPPTRRRPSFIAAGVLVIAVAALLGAYLYSTATSTISVVVAAHDLAPGDVIDRADLRVVEMGRTGELRAVTTEQQQLVLGSSPRALIPAGTILNTDLFVDPVDAIPDGMVLLAAWLKPGELVSPDIQIGAEVALFDAETATARFLGTATVWAVNGDRAGAALGGELWVTFLVDRSIEVDVAEVAEREHLRLGQVGT